MVEEGSAKGSLNFVEGEKEDCENAFDASEDPLRRDERRDAATA